MKLPQTMLGRVPSQARPEQNRRGLVDLKLDRLFLSVITVVVLFFSSLATAQTLTGTVTNGTTSKPASGDDVVLLSLGNGMQEAGRTQTDAKGNFSLKLDAPGPHLVRVIHQGVTYHRMAPPGTPSVEVQVFDVAKKVTGVQVTADVMRFQTQGNDLEGVRLFAVENTSNPPRTQMNDQNFEFYLPEGAQVDQSMAQTAGGQPINSAPVPQKEKNRYAFIFPLRPGETQFQVAFHLPYTGQVSINPRSIYGAQHFVVMVPKSMQFTAGQGATFVAMNDPRQPDAIVQVVSNTTVGQPIDFRLSGAGTMTEGRDDNAGTPSPVGGAQTARDSRPGGGLGPPIDAPDPLEKYRWYILGGFGVVLAAGAIFVLGRSKATPQLGAHDVEMIELPAAKSAARPPSTDRSMLLLDALKEELFQLEVEHKQGKITQSDYDKAKAALDQTLERALKRGTARVV